MRRKAARASPPNVDRPHRLQSRGAKMDAETKGVPPASNHDGALLSAAIRAVRRLRGMSSRDTAEAMHMPLRTYQRFESGETRPNLDHIHRFARATRSDPHALVMAVAIGAPELAVRTVENHLATIITVGLQTFNRTQGDRIADLDVRTVVGAVTAMFDRLAEAGASQSEARAWIRTGQNALAEARPKPGR
ncbi:helix-turn-helix transcriptional regulator [Brevundimonas pondensis]|uniref:helix-turn-helix domain-containing protein n=1 Tax=Brevundimonas pondensis TaxID=2774189 RepID=UPI0032098E78